MKAEARLKTYKVQKVLDRNAQKNWEVKVRAQKLNKGFMDDESYVLSYFSQLPGQEFYAANARGNVPEKLILSSLVGNLQLWQKKPKFRDHRHNQQQNLHQRMLQKRLRSFLRNHEERSLFLAARSNIS